MYFLAQFCDVRIEGELLVSCCCSDVYNYRSLMFFIQQGGPCELEVTGDKGVVLLNGRAVSPGVKLPLAGGDELVFSSCGKHAYVSYCRSYSCNHAASFISIRTSLYWSTKRVPFRIVNFIRSVAFVFPLPTYRFFSIL